MATSSEPTANAAPPRVNKLFALLIGVSLYRDEKYNLLGAVNDAQHIRELLFSLQPPARPERVIFLQDHAATASNIINNIANLSTNPDIERDDPILIYYAGHGSTLPTPAGWASASSRIQCLSPHDAHVDSEKVAGVIPDRTFGALLERLAEAKGNNITVILDCCHSGSGTRNSETIARGIDFNTDVTIDASYQHAFWAGSQRGTSLDSRSVNLGLQSHVVLSACGPEESAFEDRRTSEGRFTSALLRLLKANSADTMTHAELIRRLDDLPSQTPRCEGRDSDRRTLFGSGLGQRNRAFYDVVGTGPSCTVLAGQIHGVGEGDMFNIYDDREIFKSGGPPLGTVIVNIVKAVSSSASPINGVMLSLPKSGAVAVTSRVASHNAFYVHVDIDATLHKELHDNVIRALAEVVIASESVTSTVAVFAVSSASKASISIVPDVDDTISFVYLDERIRALGLERPSGLIPGDEVSVRSALRGVAHFFRHLSSSPSKAGLRDAVTVRLCELRAGLGRDPNGIPMRITQPIGDSIDFRTCGVFQPKLPQVVRHKLQYTLYGVDVLNRSPLDLFVWMFYFDCSTLEIINFYSPPVTSATGAGDPPLLAGMQKALPLNYGDSGGLPLAFRLPPGQQIDGGFLRIFLSTHYTDLSNVAQDPVVLPGKPKGALMERHPKPVEAIWDAITLAVALK